MASSESPASIILEFLWLIICAIIIDIPLSLYRFFVRGEKNVRGAKVLITGGAGGLGYEMGRILGVEKGAHIIVADVRKAEAEAAAARLSKAGASAESASLDVRDFAAFHSLAASLGPVDILINNAGVLVVEDFTDISEDSIRRTIDINVLGVCWGIKAFLPAMIKRRHGHIVTISSMAGWFGQRMSPDYCASKHAVKGLMESIEDELMKKGMNGIKLSTVYPNFIATNMIAGCSIKQRIGETMTPREAAEIIVAGILAERRHIWAPGYCSLLCFIKTAIPLAIYDRLHRFMGVSFK